MDQHQVKETKCNHCNEMFASKGKYDYHFRRVHQNDVKLNRFDQETISVRRSTNEKFVCICDKGYQVRESFLRHQKSCQQWKDHVASHDGDCDSELSIQGNLINVV